MAVNGSGNAAQQNATLAIGGASANASATGIFTVNSQFLIANRTNASGPVPNSVFTINGGTADIHTSIIDASTVGARNTTINLNSGTLNMNGNAIGSRGSQITTVNFSSGGQTANLLNLGGTGVNGNGLNVNGGGTLVLGGANTYTGTTNVSNGTLSLAPTATIVNSNLINVQSGANLDVTQVSGFTIPVSRTIAGGGTIYGDATVAGAITPGGANNAGTLNFNNNLSLAGGGTLNLDLGNNPGGGNSDAINITGNLGLNGTTTIAINPINGALGEGTYTLLNYASKSGAGNISLPQVTRQTLTLSVLATQTTLGVSGSAASLVWAATGSSDSWDHSSLHFKNGAALDHFFDLDTVTFDDTPGTLPTVTLSGALFPPIINVANSLKDYTFRGTGSISGASLIKSGGDRLTIGNTGSNSLSSLQVQGGTVTITSSNNIGSINLSNPVGTGTNIALQIGTGGTIGDIGPASSGAVLDLGSASQGAIHFQGSVIITGNGGGRGVITNRDPADVTGNTGGPTQANAILSLSLANDSSIGGPGSGFDTPTDFPAGRIDLRGVTTSGGGNLFLNGHTLTKIGSSLLNIANADFNFDGQVDSMDFTLLAQSFNSALPAAPPSPSLGTLVPEPAFLGGFAALALICRRRRVQKKQGFSNSRKNSVDTPTPGE